jgi:hypothetical protein
MLAILYTDTNQIRSVLGVELEDLSDTTITDRNLEKELRLDLLSWSPTHAALHAAGATVGATELAQSIADAITLYSTYFCSVLVVKSLQLAAPQSISDGKNTMSRFSTIDWQALTGHLKERLAFYKVFVQDSTSATPTAPVYNLFSGLGLSTDPVTSA